MIIVALNCYLWSSLKDWWWRWWSSRPWDGPRAFGSLGIGGQNYPDDGGEGTLSAWYTVAWEKGKVTKLSWQQNYPGTKIPDNKVIPWQNFPDNGGELTLSAWYTLYIIQWSEKKEKWHPGWWWPPTQSRGLSVCDGPQDMGRQWMGIVFSWFHLVRLYSSQGARSILMPLWWVC